MGLTKQIIDVITRSPLPHEVKKATVLTGVDFPTIMKDIIAGKKITRMEWANIEYYGFVNEGILSLHKLDGKNYQWIINDGDLNGIDWVVID